MIDAERIIKAEKILGYSFKDKDLLLTALTHSSYANKRAIDDNQRLEFLGDAVLDLLAADSLYKLINNKDEGFLTVARSRLVSGSALSTVLKGADVTPLMRFSEGVRDPNERNGARTRAALCEAIFGAVWLDGGISSATELFERLFAPHISSILATIDNALDPRGELQKYAAKNKLGEVIYETLHVDSDGSNFLYHVKVIVGDKSAEATGSNMRKAYAAAATEFLNKLKAVSEND